MKLIKEEKENNFTLTISDGVRFGIGLFLANFLLLSIIFFTVILFIVLNKG